MEQANATVISSLDGRLSTNNDTTRMGFVKSFIVLAGTKIGDYDAGKELPA